MAETTGESAGLRLLAVHAHPDDEASKGAATTAKYVAEGATVMVVTCTGGERGDILNPRLRDDPSVSENLIDRRRREMARSAEILGVEHAWLGFDDSGFPQGTPLPPLPEGCFAVQPLDEAAAPLVKIMRSFRPHVVTTYDEKGGYPHPDHIMTHKVTMRAFATAGDPNAYHDAGEPWQPLKLYYNCTFSNERLTALHQALIAEGHESPFGDWLERIKDRQQRRVDAKIWCADYFTHRDDALRAHETQIDPDGVFFAVPDKLHRQVWPTEEFELAVTLVGDRRGLESDLFDRIRGTKLAETGGELQSGRDAECVAAGRVSYD